VVRDADSTIYLFGTVHVLRPTTAWGSARVDAAFDSADQVWFEISNPDDLAALVPVMRQHGITPDRQLSHLITTGQLTLLDNAARTIGLTAVQMDVYRPWLAALTLSVAPLTRAGYDAQSGVDLVLKARADAADKPVHGFETIDKQVRILAGMSEPEQLAFLASTLESWQEAAVELDRMVEAWAAGDVATMEAVGVDEMRRESPTLYQALLVQRNTDWAGQIQTLLDGSGTVFVAVGAAHLAGEDSVQAILGDRGVTVTRE
ncbi:MAG: TraB/GumN family protein, partial [Brevundimonas sp.]